jgi:hypothetical protein
MLCKFGQARVLGDGGVHVPMAMPTSKSVAPARMMIPAIAHHGVRLGALIGDLRRRLRVAMGKP